MKALAIVVICILLLGPAIAQEVEGTSPEPQLTGRRGTLITVDQLPEQVAGLVRADLTPKPAYHRLMDLVRGKWWTIAEAETDDAGEARFRGFLGRYRVRVTTSAGATEGEIELRREIESVTDVVAP